VRTLVHRETLAAQNLELYEKRTPTETTDLNSFERGGQEPAAKCSQTIDN
jgi:hypothetical protein